MSISEDDYRAILRFRDQLRCFLHWSETEAKRVGVTPAQHGLLLAVRGHQGRPPTIGQVAEHLQLRHHSVVELIDRAESAGLVGRVHDADDRRIVRVHLEAAGQRALDELTEHHVAELGVLREAAPIFGSPDTDAPE